MFRPNRPRSPVPPRQTSFPELVGTSVQQASAFLSARGNEYFRFHL